MADVRDLGRINWPIVRVPRRISLELRTDGVAGAMRKKGFRPPTGPLRPFRRQFLGV